MVRLPERFLQRIEKQLSEEFKAFVDSYERAGVNGLRANTLKIAPSALADKLPFPVEKIPFHGKGFYYDGQEKPAKHPYYYAGLYYIQEPSAMLPAGLLPVVPGDRVLDLCAAPGGKSTELGALLDGTGLLVSNDISSSRAKALLKNIEMAGIKNAVVVSEPPEKLAEFFPGFFDKILVDAPCSGEGMFRKQPAVMKNWEQYGTAYYSKLQREILPFAVKMLKPGGKLLYSTCTFSPMEDEETIGWLLGEYKELRVIPAVTKEYAGFAFGKPDDIEEALILELEEKRPDFRQQIENCIRIWPHKLDGEGHFTALLEKDKNAGTDQMNSTFQTQSGRKPDAGFKTVQRNKISKESEVFLKTLGFPIDFTRIVVKEDRLYLLPEGIGDLKSLRLLRMGLLLGEQKKDRFEPSQALACALKAEEYPNRYSFSAGDEDLIRYLKCESIPLKKEVNPGWVLVCVEDWPIGWGKADKNADSLKNKYLPSWRML